MELYEEFWYPEKRGCVLDKTVVDILTSNERSSVRLECYDNGFKGQETCSFAINYAWRKGDRSPVLRGFEVDDKLYKIDSWGEKLLVQPTFGQLFYDEDEIELKNNFVFEGSLEEFVAEFIKAGYQVKERQS